MLKLGLIVLELLLATNSFPSLSIIVIEEGFVASFWYAFSSSTTNAVDVNELKAVASNDKREEVPVSSAIYEAVYTDITPQEVLSKLMNRKLKEEENYDKVRS